MGTVTITGVAPDPEIYGTLAAATAYIGASFGPGATKWRGLVADDQARTLVAATRYLDALELEDAGAAIGHDTVIAAVLAACAELAMLIAADPAVQAAVDAGSNVKVLDADGARIEFFRGTSAAAGTATRLPPVVQKLLGPYLPGAGSAVSIASGRSYGTTADSWFDDCDAGSRSEPF